MIETNPVAEANLAKKFVASKQELVSAVTSPDFYLELTLIGIALTLAWLVAMLVRRRVEHHMRMHPPERIETEFLLKPFSLLAPGLGVLYLSVMKPFAEEYGSGGAWTGAIISLTLAWMAATAVRLMVRSRGIGLFIGVVIMGIAALSVTGFLDSTTQYLNQLAFEAGKYRISVLGMIKGVIIFVIVFWMAGAVSRTLESYLRRSSSLSYNARELIVKFFKLFVYFVAFMLGLSGMGVDLTALAVFGGALGVGIGLGLQKITANFVSGVILLAEKSVKLGDLVEVAGFTGWVRQLNVRYTLLETFDGREVLIPNEELASSRVTNWTYSSDKARIEVNVAVAYEADADAARTIMLQAARGHARCLRDPEPNCWLREFGESGLVFMLTFWIGDVREGRYGAQSEVMLKILELFKQNGITIPYPRREVYTLNRPHSDA